MTNLNYFSPSRTQPFVVSLFMAVMAFKKLAKKIIFRRNYIKARGTSSRLTPFKIEINKSHRSTVLAQKGHTVILTTKSSSSLDPLKTGNITAELDIASFLPAKTFVNKELELRQAVEQKIADFHQEAGNIRLGKDQSVGARLQAQLKPTSYDVDGRAPKKSPAKRSTVVGRPSEENDMACIVAKNEQLSVLAMEGESAEDSNNNTSNHISGPGSSEQEVQKGASHIEYMTGTSLFFGALISLQARHGGYLSYQNGEVKASAHKATTHTRFTIKNSEDLTDIGVVRYGDALWLQAGSTEVLGAQYCTLRNQKRDIQPALISCKRNSMMRAQTYGRWIILNRSSPMSTIGDTVAHHDRIMLEQEWYYLASTNPQNSTMVKTMNNSDEAMTTKIDLFQPAEDCTWKVHLVSLPTDDKALERQRQRILQRAQDQIEISASSRPHKARAISCSLISQLRPELTDEALLSNELKHKKTQYADQAHLVRTYRKLQANNFETIVDRTCFLSRIYGADSPITLLKAETEQLHRTAISDGQPTQMSKDAEIEKGPLEILDDAYWDQVQRVRVSTKSWVHLTSAMTDYYGHDINKKIIAACIMQRAVRRFLRVQKYFTFEKAMKEVDEKEATKIYQEELARKKAEEELRKLTEIMLRRKLGISVIAPISNPSLTAVIESPNGSIPTASAPEEDQDDYTKNYVPYVSTSIKNSNQDSLRLNKLYVFKPKTKQQQSLTTKEYNNKGAVMSGRNPNRLVLEKKAKLLEKKARNNAARVLEPSEISFVPCFFNNVSTQKSHKFFRSDAFLTMQDHSTTGFNEPPKKSPFLSLSPSPPLCSAQTSHHHTERGIQDGFSGTAPDLSNAGFRGDSANHLINIVEDGSDSDSAIDTALHPFLVHVEHGQRQQQPIVNNEHVRQHQQQQLRRPHTANEVVGRPASRKSQFQTNNEAEYAAATLGGSSSRSLGLPADVFEDAQTNTSLKTGLKFLRIMSSNPRIFDDVNVKPKKHSSTTGGNILTKTARSRPQSSSTGVRNRETRIRKI